MPEGHVPAAEFLRSHLGEDEPFYSGVSRHDAVVIGDLRFHALSRRPPATPYAELHPGVVDRASVQDEIIAALERRGVRCAIVWRFAWPPEKLERIAARNAAATPDGGARRLDAHLQRRFRPIAERGEYTLLWRRGRAAPPPPERWAAVPARESRDVQPRPATGRPVQ